MGFHARREIRGARRAVVAALVLTVAWLALPARAPAAVGDLSWSGCLANDASQGCTDVPEAPLDRAFGIAVSPDGSSLYVTSSDSNSVSHLFATGPQGGLSWDGCLNSDGSQGCADLPEAPLVDPRGVAVSPDGTSVYVTAQLSGAVAHLFATGPQGQLSWDGCLNNSGAQNCGDLPAAPLAGADGVAVSPDGSSAYVASAASNSVSHLFATGPQGQLSWDGCLANEPSQGCADVPEAPLTGANGVAVSPAGESLYVTSSGSSSLSHLSATGPQGQIAWKGCLASEAPQGCVDLPEAPLTGARGVAVSPDGKSVYVASDESDSIAHFSITGAQGELSYIGCLANDASQGCTDVPAAPLDGAKAVAVSPDGRSVYVASLSSDSIAQFSITGAQGQLSYAGCLANDASQGCTDLPGTPLDGANAVAVSPDGRSVYVASILSDSIAHFLRAADAPKPGPGATPPPAPSTPPVARCAGRRATLVGTAGADRLRGTRRRDVIAALGGNDVVSALGGNDLVCGGRGRDRLAGGSGRDQLRGDAGNDTLRGGSARDRLLGGSGRDLLRGDSGNDRLLGGPGRDRLLGGSGRDRLAGGGGRDRLAGGPGRDKQVQ